MTLAGAWPGWKQKPSVLDFWPPELQENKFVIFSKVPICDTLSCQPSEMNNVGLCLVEQNEDLDMATSYGGGGSVARAEKPFQDRSEKRGDLAAMWTRRGKRQDPEGQGAPLDVKEEQERGRWLWELDQGLGERPVGWVWPQQVGVAIT